MGLSASQARLLSITARLSQNELHSQQIANSKVRLADKSSEASREYLQSLNATKLMFTTYDAKGNATQTNLTAGLLYTYEPMKSQYTLQNSAGINYVSNVDATNYENTENVYDFLNSYGLIANMAEYEAEKANYDAAMANYNTEMADYNTNYETYMNDMEQYRKDMEDYNKRYKEYEEAYALWLEEKENNNLYNIFSGAVGTSDIKDKPWSDIPKSMQCYWSALQATDQNRCSCYSHILGHIIDYKASSDSCGNNGNGGKYTTTAGDQIIIGGDPSGYMNNTCNAEMEQVSDAINEKRPDGEYKRYCDGTDDLLNTSGVENMLEKAKSDFAAGIISATEYKLRKLLSDFIDNGDGTYSVKSLKQKAIDLMYVSKNWGPALSDSNPNSGEFPESMLPRSVMIDVLINYTDGDMKNLSSEPVEPVFQGEKPEMPTPPTPPVKPTLKVQVNDLEKGQWYVNLWYMMNGADSANVLREDNDDTTNGYYVLEAEDKNTSATKCYKVLEDNLMNNDSWLKFAIEQGIVTIRKAQFDNPGETDGTGKEVFSERITWAGIVGSSMTEVSEVQDEVAIARAEAEYNKKVKDIEAKDKKYDLDIKKLDTEHNALQTEYESIQGVIQKNVDRSFKAFS